MLIITRKKGESIRIGDDIEITISKIDDGSVKIGIEAPRNVNILRKELYEEVEKENKEAANINLTILKNLKKK
ncbi:carbon storage regulator CsrA [Clostridium butyricum]|uniref:carbon storage regulator CsrA n=1 Tax=Clostridium butyricum TaxID=1492 RepID=UPI0032C01E58